MANSVVVAGIADSDAFGKLSRTATVLAELSGDLTATVTPVATADELKVLVGKADDEFKVDGDAVAIVNDSTVLSADDAIAFLRGTYIGKGPKRQAAFHSNDKDEAGAEYDYDMVVIGGGSAGMAGAKRAAQDHGQSVLMVDFVKPSPAGTKWGLGGTCVNVGCIPKKLFHTAGLHGEHAKDARSFGWAGEEAKHDWDTLVNNVTDYIKSLNFNYRKEMRDSGVTYKNALASFEDPHTLRLVDRRKRESTVTARRVMIATGGRPTALRCPGSEHAVSSDDIFRMDNPGKTLVVGASYVALECAGFLNGVGLDTTVMVRSIFLRGFDQQVAEKIGAHMESEGVKFLRPTVPDKIEKQEDGKLLVTYTLAGETKSEVFDTVLSAIGRYADTEGLNLGAAGVEAAKNGKLPVTNEQTNVPHIYAVGDVCYGYPELTPVAIQAAKLLMDRLYGGSSKPMNYELVATTVFTPLEYGAIGLPEEVAIERFGADNIEVYHNKVKPLEWAIAEGKGEGYCKLVCNMRDDMRVVGFHYLGPNAGEVTQGYGVAMLMGATFKDFATTVGIHPTTSEKFTTLTITKRSGESIENDSC